MKSNLVITGPVAALAFAGGIALGNSIVIAGVFIMRRIGKYPM